MMTAPANQEEAVKVLSICRVYGKNIAVREVSFSIRHGVIFGLLGPNGAGKSTIIKMLTTLLAPTSGTAKIDGYDIVAEPREVRAHIGYVPQLLSADGGLTGYENLMLSARLYNLPTSERAPRIQEMLALMELTDVAHRFVRTYSGGMIRKLEIAQALLHRPSVLFLDEPTIGLDPISRQAVWERLKELTAHFKLAVLITTHDMEEAEQICNELAILQHGSIVVQGKKNALKEMVGQDATLGDVFRHFCKDMPETATSYHHVKNIRKTIRRMG